MLPAFQPDGSVNVIVESPRGSAVKFKYEASDGVFAVSRPLPLGLTYPFDWGFIPSTHAADGDPVDALVVWDGSSYPGVVIRCRLIGILKVEQSNPESKSRERNDRVVALPVRAPRHDDIRSTSDLSGRTRAEIEQFFLHATAFEGKEVKLLGWGGPTEAKRVAQSASIPADAARRARRQKKRR